MWDVWVVYDLDVVNYFYQEKMLVVDVVVVWVEILSFVCYCIFELWFFDFLGVEELLVVFVVLMQVYGYDIDDYEVFGDILVVLGNWIVEMVFDFGYFDNLNEFEEYGNFYYMLVNLVLVFMFLGNLSIVDLNWW